MDNRPAGRALLPQATRNVFFLLTEARVIGTPEKFGNVIVFRSRLNHAGIIAAAQRLARVFLHGMPGDRIGRKPGENRNRRGLDVDRTGGRAIAVRIPD
jgi:hypothetical protein